MEDTDRISESSSCCRVRALGINPGILPTGPRNAITDVHGVKVGHFTLIEGVDIRTGATAILPHAGNLYQDKVPAGIVVGNGYGKLMGATQILELGELETPILLTNTLSVPQAADALLDYTLSYPGNEKVESVNMVVGETNDGWLNNIRARRLTSPQLISAIENASEDEVGEGAVGAGTGTVAFGWKGGIGTSSRVLPQTIGAYSIGVLVQTNYGGVLQMAGIPVGQLIEQYYLKDSLDSDADGSIMIVLATDAPLSDRNLTRLARRALAGLARTGSAFSNGSGDYVLAFSTAKSVRRTPERRAKVTDYPDLPNEQMSPLFETAIEATEEAIYNSLCMAKTMNGFRGTIEALPIEKVRKILTETKNEFSKKTLLNRK
ncbi:MAG TPA: P1 family peptidase [Longilinea sp.]|nr:P1 family peptidase [Longilinea sp.]